MLYIYIYIDDILAIYVKFEVLLDMWNSDKIYFYKFIFLYVMYKNIWQVSKYIKYL